jgi:DNA-binding NtrC family response regulator
MGCPTTQNHALGTAVAFQGDRWPQKSAHRVSTTVALPSPTSLARTADGLSLRDFLAIAEAWRIARALRDHRGNRSAAARALGIGRRTLYTKMEKLGLVPTWTVAGAGAKPGNGASRS